MKFPWMLTVPALVACLTAGFGRAEQLDWRPAETLSQNPAKRTSSYQAASPFRLGKPQPLERQASQKFNETQTPAAQRERPPRSSEFRTTNYLRPATVFRGQSPGVPPVPPPPAEGAAPPPPPPAAPAVAPPQDPFGCAVPSVASRDSSAGWCHGLFDWCSGIYDDCVNPCAGRQFLQSDHAFDSFISPVTNPFYFEDPRSLTEVRGIYMYQRIPGSHPDFMGGDLQVASLQGRLAITQQLCFVVNRVGWIWANPNALPSKSGFSELFFGPKFTIIRSTETQTLLAAGLTFQLPVGDADVFQNTGDLSLVPYLSFGQAFLPSDYGKFHFLATGGYSFATDSQRTEFAFLSMHLDYDVLNQHRIYPFVELNWFVYTDNGNAAPVAYEGRDLANFGARNVSGNNDMSIAGGLRFKINEIVQLGAAIEYPLLSHRDLMDYRLTFDLILRY